jgi:hypothetical protein
LAAFSCLGPTWVLLPRDGLVTEQAARWRRRRRVDAEKLNLSAQPLSPGPSPTPPPSPLPTPPPPNPHPARWRTRWRQRAWSPPFFARPTTSAGRVRAHPLKSSLCFGLKMIAFACAAHSTPGSAFACRFAWLFGCFRFWPSTVVVFVCFCFLLLFLAICLLARRHHPMPTPRLPASACDQLPTPKPTTPAAPAHLRQLRPEPQERPPRRVCRQKRPHSGARLGAGRGGVESRAGEGGGVKAPQPVQGVAGQCVFLLANGQM